MSKDLSSTTPVVLFQTDEWRVTRIVKVDRDGREGIHDIHVESRAKDALGVPYWKHEVLFWHTEHQAPEWKRLMLRVFNDMPARDKVAVRIQNDMADRICEVLDMHAHIGTPEQAAWVEDAKTVVRDHLCTLHFIQK